MIKSTLLAHLKNASKAYIISFLCCAPLWAMEPAHTMEQASNQEVFAPLEVSALAALATISVAHHATQQAPAKKFTCLTCGKNLTSNINLTSHRRIHTGNKPFKCKSPGCTYAYKDKNALTRHQKIHRNEAFKCDFPGCTSAFPYRGPLTRHQRTHTGEKPFKCDFPGCTFAGAQKINLTEHQRRIHSGEKPFKCDIPGCTYAGAFKCFLTKHQKDRHGNKKRELDENINLKKSKRYHPEEGSATETELEEGLS